MISTLKIYIYISQNLPNFPPHTIPNIQNKTEP